MMCGQQGMFPYARRGSVLAVRLPRLRPLVAETRRHSPSRAKQADAGPVARALTS